MIENYFVVDTPEPVGSVLSRAFPQSHLSGRHAFAVRVEHFVCFFSVNFLRHLLQILPAFFRIFLHALRCFLCPLPMSHGEFSLHEPMRGHTGGDGGGCDGGRGVAQPPAPSQLYSVLSHAPLPGCSAELGPDANVTSPNASEVTEWR